MPTTYYSDILSATEDAVAAFLGGKTISFSPSIFTGCEDAERELPCIIIEAQSAQAVTPGSFRGNWNVDLSIVVREQADTITPAVHRAHKSEVFDFICTDTIAGDLSAALTNWFCRAAHVVSLSKSTVDRSWVSELRLELKDVCASDLS